VAVTNSYTSPTISKVGQPRLHAGKSILKGAVPEQRPSTQHTNKVKEMQQAELHAGGVVRPGEAAKLTRPSVQTPAAVPNYAQTTLPCPAQTPPAPSASSTPPLATTHATTTPAQTAQAWAAKLNLWGADYVHAEKRSL